MMPLELGGVVDEELRVYGVQNVRIVDASIMPILIGGNPCQAVYAIAEKGEGAIHEELLTCSRNGWAVEIIKASA
jgi:choline dehydrogenase